MLGRVAKDPPPLFSLSLSCLGICFHRKLLIVLSFIVLRSRGCSPRLSSTVLLSEPAAAWLLLSFLPCLHCDLYSLASSWLVPSVSPPPILCVWVCVMSIHTQCVCHPVCVLLFFPSIPTVSLLPLTSCPPGSPSLGVSSQSLCLSGPSSHLARNPTPSP